MFGLSFALALQLTLSTRSNTAVRLATATLFFGINVFFVGTVWPYFRPLGNCQNTHAHTHTQQPQTEAQTRTPIVACGECADWWSAPQGSESCAAVPSLLHA